MDEFNLKLKLMLDITTKKKVILEQIYNITENQNCILININRDSQSLEIFKQLTFSKQNLIDEIVLLDTVFQRTFDTIKHLINKELAPEHKDNLSNLQVVIDKVIILDEKIRNQERDNNSIIDERKLNNPKINIPKTDKNKLMEHYKKNSNSFNKARLK